jgi:hypothetical protein
MSGYGKIQAAVLAQPGIKIAGIYLAVGAVTLRERKCAGAAVSTLLKNSKIRHDGKPARQGRGYHPTATTGVDDRLKPNGEASRRAQQRMREEVKAAKAAIPKPPKPPKSADMTIVRKPEPAPVAKATARPQTVEEFLANGGVIQHLPPHYCAISLRFDHSDTTAPAGRRRPVVRARPSAAR